MKVEIPKPLHFVNIFMHFRSKTIYGILQVNKCRHKQKIHIKKGYLLADIADNPIGGAWITSIVAQPFERSKLYL